MEPITHDKRLQAIQYLSNGRIIRKTDDILYGVIAKTVHTITRQERERPAKNGGERKKIDQDQKASLQLPPQRRLAILHYGLVITVTRS